MPGRNFMTKGANDLTGRSFGKWTVLNYAGSARWQCKCECGTERLLNNGDLKQGKTTNCGCSKHRRSRTAEHNIWKTITQRCCNPHSTGYKSYGSQGITMCDAWRNSFVQFMEDMGERPSPRHQIDRIDNTKGYFPENCRWVTPKEQQRNRRNNVLLTVDGETKCIAEWCELYGIKFATLHRRVANYGWSHEAAVKTPVRARA